MAKQVTVFTNCKVNVLDAKKIQLFIAKNITSLISF